jgi:hypothetical protein
VLPTERSNESWSTVGVSGKDAGAARHCAFASQSGCEADVPGSAGAAIGDIGAGDAVGGAKRSPL